MYVYFHQKQILVSYLNFRNSNNNLAILLPNLFQKFFNLKTRNIRKNELVSNFSFIFLLCKLFSSIIAVNATCIAAGHLLCCACGFLFV